MERRAKALPNEDQVEYKYAFLENAAPALTAEQEREADRRIGAYRRNPGLLVAEDDARARLKTLARR